MKTAIEWHPYPQEKPMREGEYLVTYDNRYVMMGRYNLEEEAFKEMESWHTMPCITAWAYLPKPYTEE